MGDWPHRTIVIRDERPGPGLIAAVLGVLGFVLCWIPFLGIPIGWLLGGSAILTSLFSLGRRGAGLGLVGLILGIVTILLKMIPIFNLL
jgi:hypothetical protein